MSILNSNKSDVLRGWTPGGDAGIDQSLPVASSTSIVPGMVVVLNTSGQFALPATSSGQFQPYYFVVEGNSTPEFDVTFVGKACGIRGKLTVKTDQVVSTSMAVGRLVTVNNAGQFIDNGTVASPGAGKIVGTVLANDYATDGTFTLEIDL